MQYFSFPDTSDGVSSSAIAYLCLKLIRLKTKRCCLSRSVHIKQNAYVMQCNEKQSDVDIHFHFCRKKLLQHSDKLIINLWRKRKALINDIFRTSSLQIIFEEWLCVRSKAVLPSRRVNMERPTFSLPDTLYFTIRLSRSCF